MLLPSSAVAMACSRLPQRVSDLYAGTTSPLVGFVFSYGKHLASIPSSRSYSLDLCVPFVNSLVVILLDRLAFTHKYILIIWGVFCKHCIENVNISETS